MVNNMRLLEQLLELLPSITCTNKESQKINEDGIEAYLTYYEGGIDAWFGFIKIEHGVLFTEPKTKENFDALLKKYGCTLLVTVPHEFNYEAFMIQGTKNFAMTTNKFWAVKKVEYPANQGLAKDLLEFYVTNCDKKFDDKW